MSQSRQPIIAGNWKMFKTTGEAKAFVDALFKGVSSQLQSAQMPQIVLCAPFTALSTVKETVDGLKAPFIVAAQTMESRDSGAYTGEISPVMLQDIGVQWVVLGHSERRQYFNETDETVAQKTVAALHHGMTPIVCVGELLEEREAGSTDRIIEQQVRAVLSVVPAEELTRLVFAYEPVWAIGTGKVCEAPEANRVCALIRTILNESGAGDTVRILYGGSMKADNAQQLIQQSDIDGGLVGGASLDAASFTALIEQVCLVHA